MLLDMVFRHLVTLFMILLFSILLWSRRSFRNSDTRYFWLTVVSCLLLVLEDSFEVMTATEPSLRYLRFSPCWVIRSAPQPPSACCLSSFLG